MNINLDKEKKAKGDRDKKRRSALDKMRSSAFDKMRSSALDKMKSSAFDRMRSPAFDEANRTATKIMISDSIRQFAVQKELLHLASSSLSRSVLDEMEVTRLNIKNFTSSIAIESARVNKIFSSFAM